MATKGELVEFKPGLFNIEIPDNYGIFVKTFKKKNSKDVDLEGYKKCGKIVPQAGYSHQRNAINILMDTGDQGLINAFFRFESKLFFCG